MLEFKLKQLDFFFFFILHFPTGIQAQRKLGCVDTCNQHKRFSFFFSNLQIIPPSGSVNKTLIGDFANYFVLLCIPVSV